MKYLFFYKLFKLYIMFLQFCKIESFKMKKLLFIILLALVSVPVLAENQCNINTKFDKLLYQANTLGRTSAKEYLNTLVSYSGNKNTPKYKNFRIQVQKLLSATKKVNQFNEICYSIKLSELDKLNSQV